MWRDEAGVHSGIKTLQKNGDFRSPESIELLKEADIVVTNPPFSLFREYIAQLMEYDKKFLIIGNKNAITYKEFFPLLKDNKAVSYTHLDVYKRQEILSVKSSKKTESISGRAGSIRRNLSYSHMSI